MYRKFCYLFLLLFLLFSFVEAQNDITVKITGKGLVIGTPSNLNIGVISTGTMFTKNFSGYFWIDDLRGYSTGHYTTIQCDGLYGPNGFVITGVDLLGPTIDKIAGRDNNTSISPALTSWKNFTNPLLYLYRDNIIGRNDFVNKYGNKPSIRVTVPDNAPLGNYKGEIVYTLYDMAFNY